MPATRRATAQDVADLAGVSRSAVSLVLNGRAAGIVAPGKQAAVIDAARQLAYRPNALALGLRSQRSWTLGVLTWRGVAGFPEHLLHAAWRTARAAGYVTTLMDVGGGPEELEPALTALCDRQIDGLVVVAPELDRLELPEQATGLPTVMINCLDPAGSVCTIVPDELGAAGSATQLLLERGHRRIAVLADNTGVLQAEQRVAGVLGALHLAGLDGPTVLLGPPTIGEGCALATSVLSRPDPPTAMICTRERFAVGAVLAAGNLGRRVPADLSLISLDDGEGLSSELRPEIALVQRPDRAMAEQAIALLLQLINEAARSEPRQLTFSCPINLGASISEP